MIMQDAKAQFIANEWHLGQDESLVSINPATNETIWQGKMASLAQCNGAVDAARSALPAWSKLSFDARCEYLEKFVQILTAKQDELSIALSQDVGKPLWEAKTEITAMLGKLTISKQAYLERCKMLALEQQGVSTYTRHKPHGVILVLGPFNFPGHLPNGHIIPALLAGNTVVFKPSELTPYFSVKMLECWHAAQLPAGVINMVQGNSRIGGMLLENAYLDGVFFTGSYNTGKIIQTKSIEFPGRIIALELGGNNPLVVYNPDNIDAAAYNTIQSAYITSGQRCSCARRLIIVDNEIGRKYFDRLLQMVNTIKVGAATDSPEPFMGPVVSNAAADRALAQYDKICENEAKIILAMERIQAGLPFISPGIIDVTGLDNTDDEEIFAPLLRLVWVKDLAQAIEQANKTGYGLTAGILSADNAAYQQFYEQVRAGIINWNRPTTGSSSACPFGGTGKSGNYRPSAYYAADYCAYPVASAEQAKLQIPASISPGITI